MSAGKRVIAYQVLNSAYYGALTDLVCKALAEGWEPQGGICIDAAPGADEPYYQAMIKRQP